MKDCALEGIKKGLDYETDNDALNGYTIGAFSAGIGMIAHNILDKLCGIGKLIGVELEE